MFDLIFEKRPILKKIFEENMNRSVQEFTTANIQSAHQPDENRKKELISAIKKIIAKRLGNGIAEQAENDLAAHYWCSTADHHAPLNNNLQINSNMLLASGMDDDSKSIIVLSCASISQNNEDMPRGLVLPEKREIAFLPSKNRNSVVYGFRAMTKEEIENAEKKVEEIATEKEKMVLKKIFDCFKKDEVINADDLCEQLSRLNFHWWNLLFPDMKKNLIYVEFEQLVADLLLEFHFKNTSTVLHKIIFDPAFEQYLSLLSKEMERFLRQGAFSTHLFWGLSPEKNYRIGLTKKNGKIVSKDESFSIEYTPEEIGKALHEKKIMPNMLLVFITLFLYYQLNCAGGFNQIHYLDAMQKAYNDSSIDPLKSRAIPLFNYGLECISENGIQIMLQPQKSWQEWRKQLAERPFQDVFRKSAEIFYNVLKDNPFL